MVRIGITDAWGSEVRTALGASLSNRFKAFFTGLGVTVLLQSSSATALLTASFSGQGIINTGPALAVSQCSLILTAAVLVIPVD